MNTADKFIAAVSEGGHPPTRVDRYDNGAVTAHWDMGDGLPRTVAEKASGLVGFEVVCDDNDITFRWIRMGHDTEYGDLLR